MRFIHLTESERNTLQEAYENHSKFHVRQRAHTLLLSDNNVNIKEISELFALRTRTIYSWMNRWERMGISGIMIFPGRGRKPQLSITNAEIVDLVKKKVVIYSRSLKKMVAKLGEQLGLELSCDMLRRFLKKIGYTWKRFRKSLKGKQDTVEYQKKLIELKQLIELYNSGYIDLFFADESGFNMEGYIPYGWQPIGKHNKITPAKTKGTQVFGLMSLDNRLESYSFKGSMNSDIIIAYLNDFIKGIKQKTIVVMDNAPIHKSKKFQAQIEEWKKQDLYIWFLPKYSPHLNPIEILWRFIKYQWLNYEQIQSQDELNQELEEILLGFGSEFTINFKERAKSVEYI